MLLHPTGKMPSSRVGSVSWRERIGVHPELQLAWEAAEGSEVGEPDCLTPVGVLGADYGVKTVILSILPSGVAHRYTCLPELEELSSLTAWRGFHCHSAALSCKPMTFLGHSCFVVAVADSQAVSWGIWKLSTCSLDPDPGLYSLSPKCGFLPWASLALVAGQKWKP